MFSLEEIKANLFTYQEGKTSLAHCVSKDLMMGRGIALEFKNKYGRVSELEV